MSKADDKFLAIARKRFKRCAEHEEAQRKRIVLAKQFRAGNQWPEEIKIQRQGGAAIQGQAAQPPRPCLTIDRLSQPARQISNQIKSANFAIDVLPNGHGADDDTAQIIKGYIRRVQNNARGESPVEWAADQAIEGGIGWFRLRTEYVHHNLDGLNGPEVFDQELVLERITNNLTVYCDPSATKPTRSDALFMFVTEDMDREEFKRRFDKDDDYIQSLDDFCAEGDNAKDWSSEETVRICEYWRVTFEEHTIAIEDKTRTVQKPVVTMSTINAMEELKKDAWVGSRIPLIPLIGEELNVDGEIRVRGIIEEGMDAQRMVNYMYSAAIETVALAPKAPIVVAEGQLEGYEPLWQNANRFNYSYLPYKPVALMGTPVPPPQRDQTEPAIQAMVMMLQKSEEAIKATTGIFDPSLGKADPNLKTKGATLATIQQSELGASNYPDNVARALIYAGEQMVEIIPKITRPGQLLQILGVDDQPEQVIVGQPFVENEQGAPEPVDPERAALMKGMAKLYDLSKGKYSVTVTVGKSYSTKREEGAAALGELIPRLPPEMAAPIVPEFIEQLSFPGAHKIAEKARRALPQHLRDPEDGQQPSIPDLMQQLAQAQMQLQAVTQMAQELHEQVETDAVKMNGQLQIKQLQEQADSERELARIASDERLQMAKIQVEMRKIEAELEIEAAKLGSAEMLKRAEIEAQMLHQHGEREMREQELGADAAQQDLDRQAEQEAQMTEMGAESLESARDRQFQREEGAESRAFEADQAERQRQTDQQVAKEKQNGQNRP